MSRISITLPPDLLDRIARAAERDTRSVSGQIQYLIRQAEMRESTRLDIPQAEPAPNGNGKAVAA